MPPKAKGKANEKPSMLSELAVARKQLEDVTTQLAGELATVEHLKAQLNNKMDQIAGMETYLRGVQERHQVRRRLPRTLPLGTCGLPSRPP